MADSTIELHSPSGPRIQKKLPVWNNHLAYIMFHMQFQQMNLEIKWNCSINTVSVGNVLIHFFMYLDSAHYPLSRVNDKLMIIITYINLHPFH